MKFTHTQKHFDLQPHSKLSFNEHTNNEISQTTKGIKLLRMWQSILLPRSLLIIFISFIGFTLDYGEVVYDQPSNASLSINKQQIESVQ